MASQSCYHLFFLIKSQNTLVNWFCSECYMGPCWAILECRMCQLHLCQGCVHGGHGKGDMEVDLGASSLHK